jgi:predicted Zn-ribbon and HTH transcriptional regulator
MPKHATRRAVDRARQITERIRHCGRCEHTWVAQVAIPKQCPACRSPYWNRPRVRRIT